MSVFTGTCKHCGSTDWTQVSNGSSCLETYCYCGEDACYDTVCARCGKKYEPTDYKDDNGRIPSDPRYGK